MSNNYTLPTNPKKYRAEQPTKFQNKKKKSKNKEKKHKIFKSQNISITKNLKLQDMFIFKNDTSKVENHPEYGTSNLEEKFAKEFLDKLNISYIRQFKAESIGRYYDFRIIPEGPIFEINGSYWHSDPRLYEDNNLTPTQKKNKRVDKIKKKWADEHKISIYYFWEKDINETPELILSEIKEIIKNENNKRLLIETKKKRPKK